MKQTQVAAKAIVPASNIPILFAFETAAGKATAELQADEKEKSAEFHFRVVARGFNMISVLARSMSQGHFVMGGFSAMPRSQGICLTGHGGRLRAM